LIDYFPLANKNAYITPFNPKNTTKSIYVLIALIESLLTHLSPYKRRREV
jgi:hypothetical protein